MIIPIDNPFEINSLVWPMLILLRLPLMAVSTAPDNGKELTRKLRISTSAGLAYSPGPDIKNIQEQDRIHETSATYRTCGPQSLKPRRYGANDEVTRGS